MGGNEEMDSNEGATIGGKGQASSLGLICTAPRGNHSHDLLLYSCVFTGGVITTTLPEVEAWLWPRVCVCVHVRVSLRSQRI